jgi:hypothetical protein
VLKNQGGVSRISKLDVGEYIVSNDGVRQLISLTRSDLPAAYGPLRSNLKTKFQACRTLPQSVCFGLFATVAAAWRPQGLCTATSSHR